METNILDVLRQELAKRGCHEFTDVYELNLVAIRKPTARAGQFADELHVFFHEPDGSITYAVLPCSTDPVTWAGWAKREESTAYRLLVEGQYLDALSVMHYPATMGGTNQLEQTRPMLFLEGYDRAAPLGLSVGQRVSAAEIENGRVRFVPSTYSQVAGALREEPYGSNSLARIQVWQILRDRRDYEWLLEIAHRHAQLYGPITYTLLDAQTHRVEKLRRLGRTVLLGASVLGTVLGAITTVHRQLTDGQPHDQV